VTVPENPLKVALSVKDPPAVPPPEEVVVSVGEVLTGLGPGPGPGPDELTVIGSLEQVLEAALLLVLPA
jgi:hypothetical protein